MTDSPVDGRFEEARMDAVSATNRPEVLSVAMHSDVDAQFAKIDRAIAESSDDLERAWLFLSRAVAGQGSAEPFTPAHDARRALDLFEAFGTVGDAALAGAVSAGLVFRTGDVEAAVDLAVDAMVRLDASERSGSAARAANAIALFFSHLSAFEFSYDYSLRALDMLGHGADTSHDIVRYTLCYVVVEAHHAGVTLPLDVARQSAEWLVNSTGDEVSRLLLGPGMQAEISIVDGSDELAAIDVDESVLDDAAPRLASWFRLVTAEIHHSQSRSHRTVELLDRAIPELRTVRDDLRLLRAFGLRSRARADLGDHEGAFADATMRGDTLRSWHVEQIGRLAVQISQRAELERSSASLELRATRLAEEVDIDSLTGVGSRRLLDITLDELSAHSPGHGSVVVIDLDHFKAVNDTHGHAIGDSVLRRVGEVLRSAARPDDLVARFGGEEFVAVFPGTDVARAQEYGDLVRARMAETDWNDIASGLAVRVSAGVASGPFSGIRHVMERADAALYEAKRQGRDRTVIA